MKVLEFMLDHFYNENLHICFGEEDFMSCIFLCVVLSLKLELVVNADFKRLLC